MSAFKTYQNYKNSVKRGSPLSRSDMSGIYWYINNEFPRKKMYWSGFIIIRNSR